MGLSSQRGSLGSCNLVQWMGTVTFDFPNLQGADIKAVKTTKENCDFLVFNTGHIVNLRGNKSRVSGFGYLMSRTPSAWVYHHILVCTVFNGPSPGKGYVVNHKDRNKLNNDSSNLEWVTQSENIRHGYAAEGKHGPWLGKKGDKHPLSKPVKASRQGLVKYFAGQCEASRELCVNQQNISKVILGHRKTAGGWSFEYV